MSLAREPGESRATESETKGVDYISGRPRRDGCLLRVGMERVRVWLLCYSSNDGASSNVKAFGFASRNDIRLSSGWLLFFRNL